MKSKIYIPNLNGVRCIAAFMVILSHVELLKGYYKINNFFDSLKLFGKLGVSLFFVLSGFLITFLLLSEKQKSLSINIRNFYIRRILRIWPLYYLIVTLSIFIFPILSIFDIPSMNLDIDNNFELLKIIFLFIFFLPNILVSIKLVPFATQTWSIGTEEQFYLIWPWIIKKIDSEFFMNLIFVLIVIIYNILNHFDAIYFSNFTYGKTIVNFIETFQIDCLSIGAIGASLVFFKNRILKLIVNDFSFFTFFFLLLISLYLDINYYYSFSATFYSIFFIVIILNLSFNKSFKNILENKFISYLGKISYGLYMYHQILIVFTINLLLKYHVFSNFLLYLLSICMTIIVSSISYYYYEKPFLRIKNNFFK